MSTVPLKRGHVNVSFSAGCNFKVGEARFLFWRTMVEDRVRGMKSKIVVESITTRIVTFLVGFHYKPSFAAGILAWG